jgi:hypothetical protein
MMSEVRRLTSRMRTVLLQEGFRVTLRHSVDKILVYSEYPRQRRTLARQTFVANGIQYSYFVHPYNATWRSERCVEVPIARAFLKSARPTDRVLEVGNVLSHYGATSHMIVDKYERALGVLNQDILDHRPPEPYDRILAVSTLEHVGHDEVPQENEKASRALHYLRTLLNTDGRLLVTCPLGQNPALDEAALAGQAGPVQETFLRRLPTRHEWQEVRRGEATRLCEGALVGPNDLVWIVEFGN